MTEQPSSGITHAELVAVAELIKKNKQCVMPTFYVNLRHLRQMGLSPMNIQLGLLDGWIKRVERLP